MDSASAEGGGTSGETEIVMIVCLLGRYQRSLTLISNYFG